VILNGSYGATYQTRVRARTRAGATSGWATATTVMPSGIPQGRYRGRWHTTAVRDAWGGRAIIGATGARFDLSYVGASVKLIGSVWPQGGTAQVSVDGKRQQINVASRRPHARQVLFSRALKPGLHRITIRVLRGVLPMEGLAITDRRR
jgi:hypothetical protein